MVVMQQSPDDAHCGLVYINGTPYVISSAQVQSGGQLQQVYVPIHHQQQESQHGSYVLAPLPKVSAPTAMPMVPMTHAGRAAQQGPLVPSQMVVLRSPPASLESGAEHTWVPVLAGPARAAYGDSGPLPGYHTMLPATAVATDALQGISVVTLPPQPTTVLSAQTLDAAAISTLTASDPPLQLPQQSASRQRATQCLHHLSLHQRGTARLFVGQIHYDACEDDLHQIFGLYGHVLDVKIMRSGELGPRELALPSLPASSASAAGGAVTSPAPTAIIGSDTCNDSMLVNPVMAESESSRICGLSQSSGLPPPAPTTVPITTVPSLLTASAIASAVPVPTLAPLTSTNTGNSMNPTSLAMPPPKSNRRCNAFVTYSSMIEADMAISALHGRYVMGRDRPLQVTYCQATENISQFGFAHAVRLHKENRNNPLPFKSGAPTHR